MWASIHVAAHQSTCGEVARSACDTQKHLFPESNIKQSVRLYQYYKQKTLRFRVAKPNYALRIMHYALWIEKNADSCGREPAEVIVSK